MSTCTCEKRRAGVGMGWTAAAGCLVTLARWQCWQERHHSATSFARLGHRYLLAISRRLALIPGWASS
jgi:hypothetical protein